MKMKLLHSFTVLYHAIPIDEKVPGVALLAISPRRYWAGLLCVPRPDLHRPAQDNRCCAPINAE